MSSVKSASLALPLPSDFPLQFGHKAIRYSIDVLEVLAYRLVSLSKSEFLECRGYTTSFL